MYFMAGPDVNYDISVIIPIYNAERYIKQCIKSILAQTKDRIEIIAVNDGSTDETSSILSQLVAEHSNIRVVSQENGGLAAARIAGLKAATGTYIGWVDADDFIKPEMYETLYHLAIDTGSDYVYCDYEFYPKKVATKEKWFKEYKGTRDWYYIERNTQCWNTLALRSLLQRIDLAELYLKYEEYAWIAVMLRAEKVSSTNEVLYFYRVGNETMSGGTYRGKVAHFQRGAELSAGLQGLLAGTGYETKLAEYMQYRYIYTLLQLQIVAAVNGRRDVYRDAAVKLHDVQFRNNRYTKEILDANHGKIKSFVIRKVIPSNYVIARFITSVVF